jgi:hypothetical protein
MIAGKIFKLSFFVAGFFVALLLKLRLDELFEVSSSFVGGAWGDFPTTVWFTLLVGLLGGFFLGMLKQYVLVVVTALAGSALMARESGLEEKWLALAVVATAAQVFCLCVIPKKWTRFRF